MVLIPIANGTEELEAVTIIDILRRASVHVTVAGETEVVICAYGVHINPDILFSQLDSDDDYTAIVIPGGAHGVDSIANSDEFIELLQAHHSAGKLIGALCAAPVLLKDQKILTRNSVFTSHPSIADNFLEYPRYSTQNVVEDSALITARGAATAIDFALALVARLEGQTKADSIAAKICR